MLWQGLLSLRNDFWVTLFYVTPFAYQISFLVV